MSDGNCCTPARTGGDAAPEVQMLVPGAGSGRHAVPQVSIPAGSFLMGDQSGDRNRLDGEVPVHEVAVGAFEMDATTVTNTDFAAFVDATGYVTDAERFGYSAVFHLLLEADDADVVGQPPGTPWWLGVSGADWKHPGGRLSSIEGKMDHPVVHVSWDDATAYCTWAGRRLPTESEWEYAARGGLVGSRFPWGDELLDEHGQWRCNIWQGRFPTENTADDGHVGTAPAGAFAPNAWGLHQMVGNVWEWCADWFDADWYAKSGAPEGPDLGTGRVMRGGSYLCHDSYCNRYRNSARSSNTPDSSMGNAGFRTVGPALQ